MDDEEIPEAALSWQFVRARGPGGQNVNKVATAAQLRVRTDLLGLSESARARLLTLAGSRATRDGEVVLFSDGARTQGRNRERALERLRALITEAQKTAEAARTHPPEPGRARNTHGAKTARLTNQESAGPTQAERLAVGGRSGAWVCGHRPAGARERH